ncbi:hypothetical protein, partial [Segatella oris]|uniref:hypothetical protein n=1 Tax=Segatella oris TaxID=28135 RepID=UPI001C30EB10
FYSKKTLQTSARKSSFTKLDRVLAMFYAKTLQTSARKSSFRIAECSYVLCKGKKKKPFLYLR